ncbi:hypothetical protein bcere0009_9360 [Bacillus cereus R309803]|nr:hypothetical protein bcere0009_9360 [Bacillus cereus R309803]
MNNVHNIMHFVFTSCIVKKDKYRDRTYLEQKHWQGREQGSW